MNEKLKEQIAEADLDEVIAVLIQSHCFAPIVTAIVDNLAGKLDKLQRIEALINDK